jgi:SAM-dependent methyltransferase
MKPETARVLNAVNLRFYRERAEEFDGTRARPWEGWSELYARCGAKWRRGPSVLDVGCGNARFATFLRARGCEFSYIGVDASPEALDFARKRLDAIGLESAKLLPHDFVLERECLPATVREQRFDLIVLFGVLHHIPGRDRRARLLEQLAIRLAPSGQLAISLWQFLDFDRFRKKLIRWEELPAYTGDTVDVADLEQGDAAMTWGATENNVRFCHHVDRAEASELVRRSKLTRVCEFEADGGMNRYVVLGRTA